MLVLIGPDWLTAHDEYGRRSLDDPDDFIRNEIADALRHEIPVVPVLVGGADFPDTHALPLDIGGLAERQGITLSDDEWERDFDRMFDAFNRLGWVPGGSGSRSVRSLSEAPSPAPARFKVPRVPVRIDSEPLDDGLAYYFSQSQWLDVPGLVHGRSR
jgi:hypothetical protein